MKKTKNRWTIPAAVRNNGLGGTDG